MQPIRREYQREVYVTDADLVRRKLAMIERLRRAIGLRNVLAHHYGEVDVRIVRDVLEHHLGDVDAFVAAIRARVA